MYNCKIYYSKCILSTIVLGSHDPYDKSLEYRVSKRTDFLNKLYFCM